MSSITLRKAQPRTGSSVKPNGTERRWSTAVPTGDKLVGEQGQKAVVGAWLKYALEPDSQAYTTVQAIHASLLDGFPFPPAISPPNSAMDLVPLIVDNVPGVLIREEEQLNVAAQLRNVDFEHCAEIWAQVGCDLTVWVLQYVHSRLSSNKAKVMVKEEAREVAEHGLVETGVSLTCKQEPIQKPDETRDASSVVEGTQPSTSAPPQQSTKPPVKPVGNDKLPDSAFTLLNSSTLPFPLLSIRKNFRTTVIDTIPVSKIAATFPAGTGPGVAPVTAAPSEEPKKEPEAVMTFERVVSTGKYCMQVLGKEGSVRVAKAWLHAWLVPASTQNISSVADLSTTSKRNNKDPVPKHIEPTILTPLSDIYDVYARYAFHPPRCPVLTLGEFYDVIRNNSQDTLESTVPEWIEPKTFTLRRDIPLASIHNPSTTLESPKSAKFDKPTPSALSSHPDSASGVLVQASFRYDPNMSIDDEPYLGSEEATTATVKARHFKEHDMIWRSVGLNFSRWSKAEKGKRMAKVEAVKANEANKKRKLDHEDASRPRIGQPAPTQASVFARPALSKTPEERRKFIMATWLNENYARHSDPNLRVEQKALWTAFLTQVVRALPPWESEIFTYMRPNELFGLTTEMWGTKLSAEGLPPGPDGTPRHTFWICGIVARPSRMPPPSMTQRRPMMPPNSMMQPRPLMPQRLPTTMTSIAAPPPPQNTSTIQPRNPLIQATQQMSSPSSYPQGQAFTPHPPRSAPSSREQLYQSPPAHQLLSIRPHPTESGGPYQSHPSARRPTLEQVAEGPLASPRNSLSGYLAPLPESRLQHRMAAPPALASHVNPPATWSQPISNRNASVVNSSAGPPSAASARPLLPSPPPSNHLQLNSNHPSLASSAASGQVPPNRASSSHVQEDVPKKGP